MNITRYTYIMIRLTCVKIKIIIINNDNNVINIKLFVNKIY